MPAPKHNQFWKLRSKHGRDILFATPTLLWDAACEYFQWADTHPLIEIEYKGKTLDMVQIPKLRPYTLTALCLYLGCSRGYFSQFKQHCTPEFLETVNRIEDIIYTQKFEGAAAGLLNTNIIARDLGLHERSDFSPIDETLAPTINIQIIDCPIPLSSVEN